MCGYLFDLLYLAILWMTCMERGCTWSTWTWVSVLSLLRHVTKPLTCSVTHSSLKPHAAGIHNKVQYITLSSIRNWNKDRMWFYYKLDLKQFFVIIYIGDMVLQVSPWVTGDPVMVSQQVLQWMGGQSYCCLRSWTLPSMCTAHSVRGEQDCTQALVSQGSTLASTQMLLHTHRVR